MYGTRDAAANWEATYTKCLINAGFEKGVANPCHFLHKAWNIKMLVHGDDFLMVGTEESLKKAEKIIADRFPCVSKLIGPEKWQEKELKVVGRRIRITPQGVEVEVDQVYLDSAVQAYGLQD